MKCFRKRPCYSIEAIAGRCLFWLRELEARSGQDADDLIGLTGGDGGTPEDGFADAAEMQALDQAIDPLALTHEDDPIAAIVQVV